MINEYEVWWHTLINLWNIHTFVLWKDRRNIECAIASNCKSYHCGISVRLNIRCCPIIQRSSLTPLSYLCKSALANTPTANRSAVRWQACNLLIMLVVYFKHYGLFLYRFQSTELQYWLWPCIYNNGFYHLEYYDTNTRDIYIGLTIFTIMANDIPVVLDYKIPVVEVCRYKASCLCRETIMFYTIHGWNNNPLLIPEFAWRIPTWLTVSEDPDVEMSRCMWHTHFYITWRPLESWGDH